MGWFDEQIKQRLEMDEDVEIEFEELGAGDLPRVAEL